MSNEEKPNYYWTNAWLFLVSINVVWWLPEITKALREIAKQLIILNTLQ